MFSGRGGAVPCGVGGVFSGRGGSSSLRGCG